MFATHLQRLPWQPLAGMPAGAETWASVGFARRVKRWEDLREQLTSAGTDRLRLDIFLRERRREFAIETGQIEGLYTLKRGVTARLITEGLEGVRSAHTLEGVDDDTIQGLLADQEMALELVFSTLKQERPLSHSVLCEWHALLTRHQETVVGLTPDGRRVQVPFEEKGVYKVRPNNPRRFDGKIHEYCPPEHCRSELDRLFSLYAEIQEKDYPVEVEAAWLHHRFVATHPFRDGNGRMARLLMAYAYVRRNLPPPVIRAADRDAYINALEAADQGDLRPLTQRLAALAVPTLLSAVQSAEQALKGNARVNHPNGGVTNNGRYYPPDPDGNATDPDIEGLEEFTRRSDRGRPLHFVGRQQELDHIQAALRQVQKAEEKAEDESAVGLTQLITAAPGAGKTALLRELRDRWEKEGASQIVRLKVSMLDDPVAPYLEMAIQLEPEAAEQLSVTTTESNTVGVSYFFTATQHKGEQRTQEIPCNMDAVSRWLAQVASDENKCKPIVLLVDEIQNISKLSNPSSLLRDVHEGIRDLPILMVVAGLSDSVKVLREYGISRFDKKSHLPLGSLHETAAGEAVRKFLDKFYVRGSEEQRAAWIEAIVEDSCGWPHHLVSGLDGAAQALVEAKGDLGRASIEAAREGAAKLRREYCVRQAEPFAGMPDLLSAVFLAMPKQTGATQAELIRTIHETYESNSYLDKVMEQDKAFDELLHQGLIQDIGEGRYNCPIPSLRSHVEEICAERTFSLDEEAVSGSTAENKVTDPLP